MRKTRTRLNLKALINVQFRWSAKKILQKRRQNVIPKMAYQKTPKIETSKMIKKISSFGTENRITIHLKSYTNSTPKNVVLKNDLQKVESKKVASKKSPTKSDTKSGPKNGRFYTPFDYDFIFLNQGDFFLLYELPADGCAAAAVG